MFTNLIVRGDLRSNTGYSKALRALLDLLEPHFESIYGVDIHFSPQKSTFPFRFHVIADFQITDLLNRPHGGRTVILHFTTPDGFVPYRQAYNIGYFFWETDRFRPDLFWREAILSMDEMWVPNHYMLDLIRSQGYARPACVVSWPHDFSLALRAPAPEGVFADLIVPDAASPDGLGTTRRSVSELSREYSPIYLSILTDTPRKGLPVLLAGWAEYLSKRDKKSLLLLKLSSVDVTKSLTRLREEVLAALADLLPSSPPAVDVALLFGTLSESEISGLYSLCDAYITTTFGEGFGGPIVESILHGKPFISPRHTSLQELIAPDYPFILASERAPIILPSNLPVYSLSSEWHVVSRGAVADALMRFDETSSEGRETMVAQARAYAERFCGKATVAADLNKTIHELLDREVRLAEGEDASGFRQPVSGGAQAGAKVLERA